MWMQPSEHTAEKNMWMELISTGKGKDQKAKIA
jgi:hypothetical protein